MKNFEKYKTVEKRVKAHFKWCKAERDCRNPASNSCVECAFDWLDRDANEIAEKPMPCPFCGGNAKSVRVVGGEVVKCKCGYMTAFYDDADVAVSEHNLTCRAVAAYNKSEVNHEEH